MMDKEKNFVSVVVYVHNSEDTIENFLRVIIDMMESNFEHSEIICVNDASDDESLEVIKRVAKNSCNTSVSVVNMSYFHGLEVAMKAGVDLSIGDFVFEFDNINIDYEIYIIMTVYRHALEGYDIVSASPDKNEKLTSRAFYRVFDQFSNIVYKMRTETFRILSRRVINRIESMNKTVLYRKAVYANSGLKTDNIRYPIKKEAVGKVDRSEKSYRTGLAVNSLILFTEIGYRFSISIMILFMLMILFVVVYTVVMYITSQPVAGWTTIIMFLSVCFFGLFGIQTIIVKYLQLIVDMVFKRKHYSFESIEKLTK